MAVYQFSALADGQALSFNASADRLNFDQTTIAGGDLSLATEGSGVRVTVKSGPQAGKDVLLTGFTLEQIAGGTNFTFADGSGVRAGDNTVGTAGDAGNNVVTGTLGRDLLMGLGGNDTLNGGDNNDSVVGGSGNDAVNGNSGNDWLEGNAGNDTLTGSGGQDAFILNAVGTANSDLLADFASNWDNIQLDASVLTAIGAQGRFATSDARFFAGTAAHDADDRIVYNSATGQIFYDADGNGAGAAQLIATLPAGRGVVAGDFNVFGTPGSGGGGNVINGTAGDDTLIGTSEDDTINGLGGNDSLVALEGADSLNGGDGNDTLDAWNSGPGDFAADTLDGGLGDDVYMVMAGDVIVADPGGIDTVRVLNGDWTLAADLENLDLEDSQGIAADGIGNAQNNVIRSASEGGTLFGLGGNDTLIGRNAQNTLNLEGGDGNDTLIGGGHTDFDGGAGNDLIVASSVEDNMIGGAGADIFAFNAPDNDGIQDFASGVDKIRLDGTGFAGIGASGNFSAGDARFFAGSAAHDADDRVVFNSATGQLFYDADGNGAGEQMLISHVTGNVVATDITVINGTAGGGGNTINGTSGNDTLVGGDGDDTLNGLGGNDLLIGNGGSDSLAGGDGNDIMDAIAGTEAPDRSMSGEVNTLNGGLGDDVFIAWGDDVLQDSGGLDRVVVASPGFYQLPDGIENLRVAFRTEADEHFTLIGNSSANIILPAGFRNTIDAGAGNDRIYGNIDRDNINGGDGDDWIHGGDFFNELTGGAGADHFVFDSQPGFSNENFISDFASGVDKLHFDNRLMTALGSAGNLAAGDGRFAAGAGFTSGQDSSDRLIYNTSTGNLFYDADGSGSGSAELIGILQGAPTLSATDIVIENGGIPGTVIYGTNRVSDVNMDDFIDGTPYNDTIFGLLGNDVIGGGLGNDSIVGAEGNDLIVGGGGSDTMLGGSGNDVFDLPWAFPAGTSSGTDSIDGGTGTDVLRFGFADTAASGVTVNLAAGTFSSGASGGGGGTVANVENVEGTAFNDSLTGGAGANSLIGAGGNDTLNGGTGNDTLDGGFGTGGDTLAFSSFGTANADLVLSFETGIDTVQLDGSVMTALGASGRFAAGDARFFSAPGASSGHDADDRVIFNQATAQLFYDPDGSGAAASQLLANWTGNFAQATDIVVVNGSGGGGGGGTTIVGTSGNDSLTGTTGNDTMNGSSGNDSLAGGAGNDSLTGSGGQDTFIFREFGAANADRMTDFATNWDRIQVDDAAFTEAGAAGRLSSGDARFFAGTAAHDADDRFVFNTSAGQLYYDADGNGSGAAQLVATVQAGAGVAAADITVI